MLSSAAQLGGYISSFLSAAQNGCSLQLPPMPRRQPLQLPPAAAALLLPMPVVVAAASVDATLPPAPTCPIRPLSTTAGKVIGIEKHPELAELVCVRCQPADRSAGLPPPGCPTAQELVCFVCCLHSHVPVPACLPACLPLPPCACSLWPMCGVTTQKCWTVEWWRWGACATSPPPPAPLLLLLQQQLLLSSLLPMLLPHMHACDPGPTSRPDPAGPCPLPLHSSVPQLRAGNVLGDVLETEPPFDAIHVGAGKRLATAARPAAA